MMVKREFIPQQQIPMLFVVPTRIETEQGQYVYDYTLKRYDEFVGFTQPGKRILANLCNPALTRDMVIMRVVGFDQFGNQLSEDHWIEALEVGLHSFDVEMTFMWTQSGVKNGTFVLIPTHQFAKIGRRFDLENDGYVIGAYGGLLFSDLAKLAVLRAPAVWTAAHFGEDGNGYISRQLAIELWGDARARQVRITVLDKDGYPKLLGKGVLEPISALDGDPNPVRINDTLVKWSSGVTHEDEFIIAATPVDDKPINIGITWELLTMLANVPEVHSVIRDYAVRAAYEMCSMMSDDDRVPLLRRLGQLQIDSVTGELQRADRNILSLVRSAMPWCEEMEERLGRFSIREMVDRIAPSCGIFGMAYLALQNSKFGARPCEWSAGVEGIRCVVSRLPATSMDNVVPFNRVLRNGKVHPEVMKRLGGDSDGDFIIVISDPKIVRLFVLYQLDFHAGTKQEKTRGSAPVSRDFMTDNAIQVHRDGGQIGRLTMIAHYLLMQGDYSGSALCGSYAQMYPMLAKYPDMSVDGVPLREAAAKFLEIRVEGLHWREIRKEAKLCHSLRQLGSLRIEAPASIVDHAFNWTFEGVAMWSERHPPRKLRLPEASTLAFKEHDVATLRITNVDVDRRKKVVSLWGRYWRENYGKEMSHAPWFQVIKQIGEQSALSFLVAVLRWRPKRKGSSGFSLWYHLIGTRWEELVGYHPSVIAWLELHNEEAALDTFSRALMKAVTTVEAREYDVTYNM